MAQTQETRKFTGIRLLEILAALALLLLLLILMFDWNMLKHPIERRVSAATGREFHINGDLSVQLSLKPRVTLQRVTLGNLPGAKEPQMASVDQLQFRLHLLDLLRGKTVLSEVKAAAPRVLLEKNLKGDPNWLFRNSRSEWPTIRDMVVSKGALTYRDPVRRTDIDFSFESGDRSLDARQAPLLIAGKGRYAGNPMSIEGRVESPLVLKDPGKPYHVDLRAQAGATRATAKGYLIGPLEMRGFDLDFGLAGPSMSLLFPLTGVAIPETPPYHLRGQLTREAKTWQYDNFTGVVGDSDLSGDASVDTSNARPFLKADLVSKRLDFDDLAGFVGAPPQTSAGETASTEQKAEAAKLAASARVLPDDEFTLEKLRSMDADVKLRAKHINAPSLPLEAMTAHLFLNNAVLRLDPLNFDVAGGSIDSRIKMDARKDTIASTLRIHARGLQLPKLFPKVKLTEDSAGRVGGSADLTTTGNSIARMAATANGDLGLIMGSGRISNLLMEFAGIDIAESLKFLIGKDRTIPIRCAFGDFEVHQGLMTTNRLAFDTTDTVILGDGTISLRDERLDLILKPQPKDHSIFSLRAPLLVRGTFKDPEFRPDIKKITLRGLAAAILGALAPPAALIALYETGPGKDVACRPGSGSPSAQPVKTTAR
ncbi:MAG: AsmA family protein [Arenimonas sp.]